MHTCASSEPPPFSSLIFDETLSNLEQLGNSTLDNTTYKDARSLIVFLAQSAGFLVLTVLAILRYADVIKTRSHGSNYPRQSRDMSVELRGNAVGMSVAMPLACPWQCRWHVSRDRLECGIFVSVDENPSWNCHGHAQYADPGLPWCRHRVDEVFMGDGHRSACPWSPVHCPAIHLHRRLSIYKVFITIVYIIAEGLSASYYYQRNSTCQHGSFDILKRVCTTSFGSIFQAACAPFWFHFGNPKYSTVKPSIAKYALYYVAALDADYSKVVTDVETSFAKSGMTSRLEMYIMEKVLFTNALKGGLATGVYFYGIIEDNGHNAHILCICVLATFR
ncbi:MAG: hypothetical protein BYD32DRAFT_432192 [Podila humilis]|nr:MAG: hypothetical protein BYD32DRAFT_432192 [Podila humilis]